jgi:hypothetical protein
MVQRLTQSGTLLQIWGFEMINGERFYTRRIAATSADGEYVLVRMVISFLKRKEEREDTIDLAYG